MKPIIPFAFAAALLASACVSVPSAATAPAAAVASIPSEPLELGDWRRGNSGAAAQHFERAIAARYGAGLALASVSSDLRRNDFACVANRDTAGRGDPPDQICRKAVAADNCTHTWQVHLYDAGNNNVLVRARALYDRHCGGDGLLGGPG